jgi:hypothetical protein
MRRKPLNGRWGPLETILANPKGAGRMLSATPVVDQRTGIQLERGEHPGRLVVSMWLDTAPQKVQLIYSDDGVKWTRGATSTGEWSGEPAIFERNNGDIYVMARNQGAEEPGDTTALRRVTGRGPALPAGAHRSRDRPHPRHQRRRRPRCTVAAAVRPDLTS